jgi:hypothetical protein
VKNMRVPQIKLPKHKLISDGSLCHTGVINRCSWLHIQTEGSEWNRLLKQIKER